MGNFLDKYQIPKLNQDQIDQLTPKELEGVIESLPSKKKKKKKKNKTKEIKTKKKKKT